MRAESKVAPGWWDYTTLDREILDDAARLSAEDLAGLAREGFAVRFYDTLEDFYLAERSNTSPPGGKLRPTGRPVSVGRSGPPSNCRWWLGW